MLIMLDESHRQLVHQVRDDAGERYSPQAR
jgi:hypothetical protein